MLPNSTGATKQRCLPANRAWSHAGKTSLDGHCKTGKARATLGKREALQMDGLATELPGRRMMLWLHGFSQVKTLRLDQWNSVTGLGGEARCTYCGVQIWLTDLRVINRVVFAARVGNGFASASAMAGISALQFLLFEAKHDMASQRPVLKKLAFPKVGLPKCSTRWWFQIFFYFHPYLGKIPIVTNIFQRGWNHQLVYVWIIFLPLA